MRLRTVPNIFAQYFKGAFFKAEGKKISAMTKRERTSTRQTQTLESKDDNLMIKRMSLSKRLKKHQKRTRIKGRGE